MPVWSRNHRACTTTWTTLFALTQLRATFDDSGVLPMPELLFWAGSARARATRAESLSNQIDNIFRLLRGARFEDGVDRPTAIARLRDTLLVEANTVASLAEEADGLYRFFGESEMAPELHVEDAGAEAEDAHAQADDADPEGDDA